MKTFELCETSYGTYLLRTVDLISHVIKGGTFWEEEILPILEELTSDMVVIEVGSYIGDHTVYLSNRCKEVYTFEGNISNYYQLGANLLLNDCTNVRSYNKCIGDAPGFASFAYTVEDNYAATVYKKDAAGSIPIYTLDNLLFEELERLDFIITDAEGFDLDILIGAKSIINKFRPLIIFEFNAGHLRQSFSEYENYLENFGYNIIELGGWNFVARYKK